VHSFTTSLVEKSSRYSHEPDRVRFHRLVAEIQGDNDSHTVSFDGSRLSCDCDHSQHEGVCAHVVAFERLFRVHLPHDAVVFPGYVVGTAGNQQ
jgi:hypothetical protein